MEDKFPKYQYSKFDVIGKGDQIVVRTNDKSEFEEMVEFVKTFGKDPTDSWASSPQPLQEFKTPTEAMGFCKDCGGPKIMGKNGKPYCKPCYIKWANANKK